MKDDMDCCLLRSTVSSSGFSPKQLTADKQPDQAVGFFGQITLIQAGDLSRPLDPATAFA
jgi:hypothetical protein